MLTTARAAFAGVRAAGLRAALGRAAQVGPWARRAAPEAAGVVAAPIAGGALRLSMPAGTGPLKINPMSGAVFAGRRPLDLAGPDRGGDRPTDWLVQAFPSPLALRSACPLWYGYEAGLEEVLALSIALGRASAGTEALVALPLGRTRRFQAALAAGAFGDVPVRVHAWDKVIAAEEIVTRPVATEADRQEAVRRLAKQGL